MPDDGRTVYSMDGLQKPSTRGGKGERLPKEDRREMIKAALSVYGPIFLIVTVCFSLVAILLYFWLK